MQPNSNVCRRQSFSNQGLKVSLQFKCFCSWPSNVSTDYLLNICSALELNWPYLPCKFIINFLQITHAIFLNLSLLYIIWNKIIFHKNSLKKQSSFTLKTRKTKRGQFFESQYICICVSFSSFSYFLKKEFLFVEEGKKKTKKIYHTR